MHLQVLQEAAVHAEACKSSAGVSYGTASICNIGRACAQWPVNMLPLHAATATQLAQRASHAMRLGACCCCGCAAFQPALQGGLLGDVLLSWCVLRLTVGCRYSCWGSKGIMRRVEYVGRMHFQDRCKAVGEPQAASVAPCCGTGSLQAVPLAGKDTLAILPHVWRPLVWNFRVVHGCCD